MIEQPKLGKKISDLRKAKGFTQEELVEKCNLSVRTLQRIEAGEVTPRINTVKLILEVLELDFENTLCLDRQHDIEQTPKWRKQFFNYFIDLFNLKTNTTRKLITFSLVISLMAVGMFLAFKNDDNHFNNEQKFKKSATAKWIAYPKHFTEFIEDIDRKAKWECSRLEILGGKYTIGVGPYSFEEPNDGVYDYFCIDIEEPIGWHTSIVITELDIDLKYVSTDFINSKAEKIVKFDSKTNIITFDLGNSIFTCKFKPKDKK